MTSIIAVVQHSPTEIGNLLPLVKWIPINRSLSVSRAAEKINVFTFQLTAEGKCAEYSLGKIGLNRALKIR